MQLEAPHPGARTPTLRPSEVSSTLPPRAVVPPCGPCRTTPGLAPERWVQSERAHPREAHHGVPLTSGEPGGVRQLGMDLDRARNVCEPRSPPRKRILPSAAKSGSLLAWRWTAALTSRSAAAPAAT